MRRSVDYTDPINRAYWALRNYVGTCQRPPGLAMPDQGGADVWLACLQAEGEALALLDGLSAKELSGRLKLSEMYRVAIGEAQALLKAARGSGPLERDIEQGDPSPTRPLQRQAWRASRILEVLVSMGHDPVRLPRGPSGSRDVKAECRDALKQTDVGQWSDDNFRKAWQSLRDDKQIADA
jgi:hypothetical protein